MMDIDLYSTIARLLPAHRDVIQPALATSFVDYADNLANALAAAVPPEDLPQLFADLAKPHVANLENPELDVHDVDYVETLIAEFGKRAERLKDGPCPVSPLRPRKK